MSKHVYLLVAIIAFASCSVTGVAQRAGDGDSSDVKHLNLVAEYKNDILLDLSSDGKYLLFYNTDMPVRQYYVPTGGSAGKTNVAKTTQSFVRVVDRETGRERGRIETDFLTWESKFLSNTTVMNNSGKAGFRDQIWDVQSNSTRGCISSRQGLFVAVNSLVNIDRDHVEGWGNTENGDRPSFISIDLKNCSLTKLGPLDPLNRENPRHNHSMTNLAISPDKETLAYIFEDSIVVYDIAEDKPVKTIDSHEFLFGHEVLFTPDGKYLIVSRSDHLRGSEPRAVFLQFYDRQTGTFAREFKVEDYDAIAVSPDGKYFALGYQQSGKGAPAGKTVPVIAVYDISSGEELVRTSFPGVKLTHNTGSFPATIDRLMFTPDGNYLVASIFDTRIWRIS